MRQAWIVLIAMFGMPASAQDIFLRPSDCVLKATMQMDDCEVDNLFQCPAAPEATFRTESFDTDGLYAVSLDDPATGQFTADFVGGDGSMKMQMNGDTVADVASNGSGSSSVTGEFMMFGLWRPLSGTETSMYRGESIDLAGKTFKLIDVAFTLQLPYPVPTFTGREVRAYNEELDLSVSVETVFDEGASIAANSKLMQLSLSGQPGFGDEQPRYGCMILGKVSEFSVGRVSA